MPYKNSRVPQQEMLFRGALLHPMPLTLIAARAKNGCIGKHGQLPWHLPEDIKHFRDKTMGKTVLMGRKTWESIPAKHRPLPGRQNVVISRDKNFIVDEHARVFHDLDTALQTLSSKDVYVIGGAEIYRQCLPHANTMELTEIAAEYDGDVFFPAFDSAEWRVTAREDHDDFAFVTYTRL